MVRVLGIERDALNANGCRRKMSTISTVHWLQNDNYSYNKAVDLSFRTTLKIIIIIITEILKFNKYLCLSCFTGQCSAIINGHKDK